MRAILSGKAKQIRTLPTQLLNRKDKQSHRLLHRLQCVSSHNKMKRCGITCDHLRGQVELATKKITPDLHGLLDSWIQVSSPT